MEFQFGDSALIRTFTPFSDTVSMEYDVSGLCNLTYQLSLATDAT